MANFTYTPTQGGVNYRPVASQVTPDLSSARAVNNLSNVILKGAQFAGQLNQQDLEAAAQQQQQDLLRHKEAWAGMTYKQRKDYINTIQTDLVGRYAGDGEGSKKLAAQGNSMYSAFAQSLVSEGVEEEYLNNKTSQAKGLLEYQAQWEAAETTEQRNQLLQEYDAQFVDPYKGYEDKYSRSLYENGIKAKSSFQSAYQREVTAIADQEILLDVQEAIQTGTAVGMDYKELVSEVSKRLGKVSDFGVKKSQYLSAIGQQLVMGVVNNAANQPRTYENGKNFQDQLAKVAEADPRVKGTDTYKAAMTSARAFVNQALTKESESLMAMISNDNVPFSQVVGAAARLTTRGGITAAQAENYKFLKQTRMNDRTIKAEVVDYYQSGDTQQLKELVARGKGSMVSSIVADNLNLELAAISETKGVEYATAATIKKWKQLNDAGVTVGDVELIDSILDGPYNNGIKTPEDVTQFVNTMKNAAINGYTSTAVRRNMEDYMVLAAWQRMGVEDVVGAYRQYKTAPKTYERSKMNKMVDEIFNDIVDNEYWAENLDGRNHVQMRSALEPAIRAGLKAGIDPDDMADDWDTALHGQFYEADIGFGANGRVMLPSYGSIKGESNYKTITQAFGKNSHVQPADVLNPAGKWIIYEEGKLPYARDVEYLEFISETGRLPEEGEY